MQQKTRAGRRRRIKRNELGGSSGAMRFGGLVKRGYRYRKNAAGDKKKALSVMWIIIASFWEVQSPWLVLVLALLLGLEMGGGAPDIGCDNDDDSDKDSIDTGMGGCLV